MSTLKQIEQAGFKVGSLINIKGSGTKDNYRQKRIIVRFDINNVYYITGDNTFEHSKPIGSFLEAFELAESLPLGNSKTNEPYKFSQGDVYIDKTTGSKMLILSKSNTYRIYALHKNERIVKYDLEDFLDSIEHTNEGLPIIHTTRDIRSLSLITGSTTMIVRDVLENRIYYVKPEDAFNTKAKVLSTSVLLFNNNFKPISFDNGDKVTEQSKLPVDSKEEKGESHNPEEPTYKVGSRLELITGGHKGTFATIRDYNKDSGIYDIYEDAEKRTYSFSKEYIVKYYKLADKETSDETEPLTHKYPITPLETVRGPDVVSVGVDSKGNNELIVSPDLSPEEPLEEEVYHEPEMPSFPSSISKEQNTDDIELGDCIPNDYNPLPLEPPKTIPYKGKHTMLSMDFDFDDDIVEFEF